MPVTLRILGGTERQQRTAHGFAYATEHGLDFADPVEGATGWVQNESGTGRHKCRFNGACWEEIFEPLDDGM